ncbi:nuclear envelope integral membrane protein 1 isoform X7 [Cygnus atratus]|uniref:nuclear envelope integral membrane protein 1 isoform X7 n=1 Tax=Cygnus atratus TaxID=8868 RepID=UPI0015D5E823|nr:nuclear envelope integral membrane protein 1 isoform X7 [Cygnus atratus]
MAGRTNAARARLRLLAALLLLLLLPLGAAAAGAPEAVVELREDRACYQAASHRFCYTNTRAPQWHDIWTRVQIRVNSSQGIRVTQVDSEEELRELEEFRVWNFLFSFLKEKLNNTSIDVDLYGKKTCLKVEVPEAGTTYCVMLSRRFDPKLFLVFFLGLLLFFCGDVLSRSQLFYYSAGISIGLLASVLIVFYVMSKVMPKKSPVYLLLVGGWSFSLYLLQLIFKNLREICKSYWQYLLSYMLLVGLLLGLLLMYSGIQIRPVALALVLVAICAKHLDHPVQWAYAAYRRAQSARLGPSPPRLLTEEEYRIQGEVETRKALEELRSYCRSPDFSAWTAVSRIQSPKRFADFVGGASHLTSREISFHEQEYGLGGSLFEEQLFEEEEEDDSFDTDHRSGSLSYNRLDAD